MIRIGIDHLQQITLWVFIEYPYNRLSLCSGVRKESDLAAQKRYICSLISPKLFEMVQFGKNQKFLNFCNDYNGFCLKFQPSMFSKVEIGDFGREIFEIAIF